MHVRILGSAAGGGVPQWNCRCPNCVEARSGSIRVAMRTQCSVAVSGDGTWWFLVNVSPDIREQLSAFERLGPDTTRRRGTMIAGCILTDAELDHTLGLLGLREGERFDVLATPSVRYWLHDQLPIGRVLAASCRRWWRDLELERPTELRLANGGRSGLRIRAFETGRIGPRYLRGCARARGASIGLVIEDVSTGGRLVVAPSVPAASRGLANACESADAVLLDGTFWSRGELSAWRGDVPAVDAHHWPVGGAAGSLTWLGWLAVPHRAYIHINNTNPMLDKDSVERRETEAHGVRVSADGDAFQL